jgi:Predicted nucleoside-diphosphate-sugar epimerases
LVTGATGKIGREVVRQLTAAGTTVRALVHSPEKGKALEQFGAEIVLGDLGQPESMSAALKGTSALFLLSPIHASLAEREQQVIQAAVRAKLTKVVLLSGRGATLDSPSALVRMHAQSEHALRDSGLMYTILRPDYFMQNMLGYAPSIQARGRFESTHVDAPWCMIDCRDIAAVAVAALTEEGHAGRSYDLTGPQAISIRQASEKLSAGLGKPVSCVEISPETVRERMLAMKAPEWLVRDMTSAPVSGDCLSPTSAVAEVTNRPPLTFDQFAHDYALAFIDAAPSAPQ